MVNEHTRYHSATDARNSMKVLIQNYYTYFPSYLFMNVSKRAIHLRMRFLNMIGDLSNLNTALLAKVITLH